MYVTATIPMSSPKTWPDTKRMQRKIETIKVIHKVLANGNSILLFPAGKIRTEPKEVVAPYLSGVYEILRAEPNIPVILLRLDGLGKFQFAKYDGFWSFLGLKNGRRHINVDIRPVTDLDPSMSLVEFNIKLEELLNRPIEAAFPNT